MLNMQNQQHIIVWRYDLTTPLGSKVGAIDYNWAGDSSANTASVAMPESIVPI